jgi:hypothetical protein
MEVDGTISQLCHLALDPEKLPAVVDHQVVPLEVTERQQHNLALERQGSDYLRPAHLAAQTRVPHGCSLTFVVATRESLGGLTSWPQVGEEITPLRGRHKGTALCGIQEVRGSNPLTSTRPSHFRRSQFSFH